MFDDAREWIHEDRAEVPFSQSDVLFKDFLPSRQDKL